MENNLINRQEAIDAICKACSMEGDYHKCDGYPATSTGCDELVALRALPSAQQWIPVTERLPEETGYYLTSTEDNDVLHDFFCDGKWENAELFWYKVVAWMPLPEPYKRSNEGSE